MRAMAVQKEFRALSDLAVAKHSLRYFKTGEGQYAEGDQFLGIRVPIIRAFAKRHKEQPLDSVLRLLSSRFHEERLLALIMMVNRFEKADDEQRRAIYTAYLDHTVYINNWDLVDSSAYQIVGRYLFDTDRRKLHALAKSKSLWERRISIVATYYFIKNDQYDDTLSVSRQLLHDKEDLIHKAVGWMLREVGNRDRDTEERFLIEHYQSMPRTMLRYAIEKFDEKKENSICTVTSEISDEMLQSF